jgi:hypothetical protein
MACKETAELCKYSPCWKMFHTYQMKMFDIKNIIFLSHTYIHTHKHKIHQEDSTVRYEYVLSFSSSLSLFLFSGLLLKD